MVPDLIDLSSSFNEEIRISLSNVIRLLEESYPFPFTVEFTKQDGSSRTLHGIFSELDSKLGRTLAIDLEKTVDVDAPALRQIDNRTIKTLITKGIKYKV